MRFDSKTNKLLEEPAPNATEVNDVVLRKFADEKCRTQAACTNANSGYQACYWHGFNGQTCLRLVGKNWIP